MVEVMNAPDGTDLRRLQALTQAARVLLKAVGVPQAGFFFHFDRRDTPAQLPHLRRYDPPAPDPSAPPAPGEEPVGCIRPREHVEMLGPALRTLQLHAPEGKERQPIYWLEPDSSVDEPPWNSATTRLDAPVAEEDTPSALDAPAPSAMEAPVSQAESSAPDQPNRAVSEPHRPGSAAHETAGPRRPEAGSPGAPAPEPCSVPSRSPSPSGQARTAPPAQAADKRWTSAPATTNESASVDPDLCPSQDLPDDPTVPTPDVVPLSPAPDCPPPDEPESPPRRPCIALFSVRPIPGSRSPW
jgi:hypothetical protein